MLSAMIARVQPSVAVVATFAGVVGPASGARGQTPVESSAEVRFQLDVHVPQAALLAYVPAGFTLNVAAQGAAKDANLRVVFIDRMTVHKPDGTPVGGGSSRLVYLVVPVRDPAGSNAQLVIGGLTDEPADAPGPFGVYLPAATHTVRRSVAGDTGADVESQDWTFRAATGEFLEMHIAFVRAVRNRGRQADVKFYSARQPDFFQISRQEQVLDILRNVTTTPPDRVREFSFRAGGGSYAALFDGTERLLSWDNILWLSRTVLVP